MATLDQLLNQYGVAYFTFDEETGNVYDKIGLNNYVGTVTGATRVNGWNGVGKAMSFNGSQYILFNNTILPTNDFTIRLKIKTEATTNQRILNTLSTTSPKGFGLDMVEGTVMAHLYNIDSYIGRVSSQTVNDNKWKDILVSFNTEEKMLYLYVDEVLEGKTFISQPFANGANLNIAQAKLGYGGFVGLIDELQIYNKALSPSDFPKERVAIKSSTKNYTPSLSDMSTRIKEIPNVNSSTLISQGATIQEIKYAIDNSTSFNLEKTIDEYEVASDINTPLGSGKVFTISTTQEFKTISIEDNY